MKLYIEQGQTPSSIVNAFFQADDNTVDLIFSGKTSFFNDEENITLLKNQAAATKKIFTVITKDPDLYEKLVELAVPVKLQEESAPPRRKSKSVKEDQPFFQKIQHELNEGVGDEFTKRYFDLGAPAKTDAKKIDVSSLPSNYEEYEVSPLHIQELPKPKEGEIINDPVNPSFQFLEPHAFIDEGLKDDLARADSATRRRSWIRAGVVSAVLLAIAFAYFELPRATITIFAQREKISFAIDVTGEKLATGVDVEKRSIPVQVVQISKTLHDTFTVTTPGSLESKAHVTVTIYNNLFHPQGMVPSRFQSSKGQIYWSQRNIKIPEAAKKNGKIEPGTLTLEIIADQKGADFNLDCSTQTPCQFTIPAWKGQEMFTKIYARATLPITGGGAGQGYIVSDEEYQKAETSLRQKLLDEGKKTLGASIPFGFLLLENTLDSQISNLYSSPKVGEVDKNGKANIQGDINIKAFLIKNDDIKMLIDKLVKSQLKDDKITRPESVTFEQSIGAFDFEQGTIALNVQAQEETSAKVNIEEIKKQLLGKQEEEVRQILSKLPTIQSAQVTLWPFWVRTIPLNVAKIIIEVK